MHLSANFWIRVELERDVKCVLVHYRNSSINCNVHLSCVGNQSLCGYMDDLLRAASVLGVPITVLDCRRAAADRQLKGITVYLLDIRPPLSTFHSKFLESSAKKIDTSKWPEIPAEIQE